MLKGNVKDNLRNALILSPFVVGVSALSAFAEGGGSGGGFTLPSLDASALAPISTAFNQYATPIMVAGVGFIAVKKGISFVPKLINMFFK